MAKYSLTHKVVLKNGLTHGIRIKGQSIIFKRGQPVFVTEEIADTLSSAVNQATQVVGDKVSQIDQPRFDIEKLSTALTSREAARVSTKGLAAAKAAAASEEDGDEGDEGDEGTGTSGVRDR